MSARDAILERVRQALGRTAGEAVPDPPPARLRIPEVDMEARVAEFRARIEALGGLTERAGTPAEALAIVARAVAGKSAVASNAAWLAACGIPGLPEARCGIYDREELRACCAEAAIGITSADYALADTGTLVLLASPQEARLISLLPPAHIAVIPRDRILTNLEELFTVMPVPNRQTSSMVLITGPSRTADIEQILVRGVHGPGQLSVVIVG